MRSGRRRAGFPFLGIVCVLAGFWATLEPIGTRSRKFAGPIAIVLGLYVILEWLRTRRPRGDE
jgi:hypothetical protein